jgi:hypothetical protein
MLAKCANPSCSHPFRYLHEGKLYRMEWLQANDGFRPNSEWFWLCDQCSSQMTLRVEGTQLIAVDQLPAKGEASGRGEKKSHNNSKTLIKSCENTTFATTSMRIQVVSRFEGLRGE